MKEIKANGKLIFPDKVINAKTTYRNKINNKTNSFDIHVKYKDTSENEEELENVCKRSLLLNF